MGIDQNEHRRGRDAGKPKHSSKHPIAAIEKRIIDSPAYADLAFSSRAVLLLLARNLEKNRNGHIQLSEKQSAENGIDRKTLRRALADLREHQLIVMTWRGGRVQGLCNKYALTWLPVKERAGIHADLFKLDAWRGWIQCKSDKTASRKCPLDGGKNVPLRRIENPEMSPTPGAKSPPIEVITIPHTNSGAWQHEYLARLSAFGLDGRQCFEAPAADKSGENSPQRANAHGEGVSPCMAEKTPLPLDNGQDDDYVRCADEVPAEYWDADAGEFRIPANTRRVTTGRMRWPGQIQKGKE